MANQNLNGPYILSNTVIDEVVNIKSPGCYLLGVNDGPSFDENKFLVSYVGRSDDDLNARLKDHINNYDVFAYCYASTPKNAILMECENYHDYGESEVLDNEKHPDSPNEENLSCPYC